MPPFCTKSGSTKVFNAQIANSVAALSSITTATFATLQQIDAPLENQETKFCVFKNSVLTHPTGAKKIGMPRPNFSATASIDEKTHNAESLRLGKQS